MIPSKHGEEKNTRWCLADSFSGYVFLWCSILKDFQQGLVNVPFWEYWTSPYSSHLVDHIPNGWVMFNGDMTNDPCSMILSQRCHNGAPTDEFSVPRPRRAQLALSAHRNAKRERRAARKGKALGQWMASLEQCFYGQWLEHISQRLEHISQRLETVKRIRHSKIIYGNWWGSNSWNSYIYIYVYIYIIAFLKFTPFETYIPFISFLNIYTLNTDTFVTSFDNLK